jgi:hypothetical protein
MTQGEKKTVRITGKDYISQSPSLGNFLPFVVSSTLYFSIPVSAALTLHSSRTRTDQEELEDTKNIFTHHTELQTNKYSVILFSHEFGK